MKGIIKKFISLTLVLALLCAYSVSAFATTTTKNYQKSSSTNLTFVPTSNGVPTPFAIGVTHNIYVTELRGSSDKEVEDIRFYASFDRYIDPVLIADVGIEPSEIKLDGDSLSFDTDPDPQIIPDTDYWFKVLANPYRIFSLSHSYSVYTHGLVRMTDADGKSSSSNFYATLTVS